MGCKHIKKMVFPKFMRDKRNKILEKKQSKNIEGYVYDGADASQVIHWTCKVSGTSEEHVHDYDEYFIVVEGKYILKVGGKKVVLTSGKEYYIKKGTPHSGEFIKGTRTIHFFGGKRAERMKK